MKTLDDMEIDFIIGELEEIIALHEKMNLLDEIEKENILDQLEKENKANG